MCKFVIATSIALLFMHRKSIFNQIQDYIHFNLSFSLLIGLLIFVSGIQTAVNSDVSYFIFACNLINLNFRQDVWLWLYCFTTSSWWYLIGCFVKASYCLQCSILYSIKEFSMGGSFLHALVGVCDTPYFVLCACNVGCM